MYSSPLTTRKSRPIRSCLSCRARRVKCDQARPSCSECRRIRRACRYDGEGSNFRSDDSATPEKRRPEEEFEAQSSRAVPIRAEDLGFLSLSIGGSSRYVGPSFWGISTKNEPEFPAFLEDRLQTAPHDHACFCTACNQCLSVFSASAVSRSAVNGLQMHGSLYSLEQILAELPPRQTCDRFLTAFFNTIYPLVAVLHLPSFLNQYEDFWVSYESINQDLSPGGVLGSCPTFVPLLIACLFCGSLSDSAGDTRESMTETATQSKSLRDLTVQSLGVLNFPRDPTLYSLAAFVILHVPMIREESERSVAFVSTAYRVALALGLHRDPEHFKIQNAEAEIRRRLWWNIVHRDTLSSVSSGLPPMIWNRKQHDTSKISELAEFNLDPSQDEAQMAMTSLQEVPLDCRQFVAAGRFLVSDVIRKAIERQIDSEPWSLPELVVYRTAIERVAEQIQDRVARLQQGLDAIEVTDLEMTAQTEPQSFESACEAVTKSWTLTPTRHNRVFLQWSTKMLCLTLEKAYCVLYTPFQRQVDRSIWERIRARAVSHCHAYLEQYISLCTETAYDAYQWLYPGTFQPIQAVSALLIDMAENPASDEAPISRRLIDRIFSLLNHEQGVVAENRGLLKQRRLSGSGREAWRMLWRLRKRTWIAGGVNPNATWPYARNVEEHALINEDDLQNLDVFADTSDMPTTFYDGPSILDMDVPGDFSWDI